jgi:hypothetical protein
MSEAWDSSSDPPSWKNAVRLIVLMGFRSDKDQKRDLPTILPMGGECHSKTTLSKCVFRTTSIVKIKGNLATLRNSRE